MKVNIKMIRNMDKENTLMEMEMYTKENGKMDLDMEKECIHLKKPEDSKFYPLEYR